MLIYFFINFFAFLVLLINFIMLCKTLKLIKFIEKRKEELFNFLIFQKLSAEIK